MGPARALRPVDEVDDDVDMPGSPPPIDKLVDQTARPGWLQAQGSVSSNCWKLEAGSRRQQSRSLIVIDMAALHRDIVSHCVHLAWPFRHAHASGMGMKLHLATCSCDAIHIRRSGHPDGLLKLIKRELVELKFRFRWHRCHR